MAKRFATHGTLLPSRAYLLRHLAIYAAVALAVGVGFVTLVAGIALWRARLKG